jgi:hypothetical protein
MVTEQDNSISEENSGLTFTRREIITAISETYDNELSESTLLELADEDGNADLNDPRHLSDSLRLFVLREVFELYCPDRE